MTDHAKDDAIRLAVRMRRHEHPEEQSQPIAAIRGDFLAIAQGDQVVLLTKKELFRILGEILKFSNG